MGRPSIVAAAVAHALAAASSVQAAGLVRVPVKCVHRPQSTGQQSKAAAEGRDVPLRKPNAFSYLAHIRLGTPPIQEFFLDIDLSREHTWVPAKSALTDKSTHAYYVAEDSSTYSRMNRNFVHNGISGMWARDVLSMGPFLVEGFRFGIADSITTWGADYERYDFDGNFGLGFEDTGVPWLLRHLVEKKLIEEPVFALYFNSNGGEMAFGGADPARHEGKMQYVALARGQGWTMPVDAIWIGDKRCFTTPTSWRLAPDLMSIEGPQEQMESFISEWNATKDNDGWYPIPCDKTGPALILRIFGRDYVLTKNDLLVRIGSTCYLGVSVGTSEPWTLGQVFLRAVYTEFDAKRKRVGLARANHSAGL